jgi:hypothetical protein
MIALLLLLFCLIGTVLAGQPDKIKTVAFAGTAPPGTYTHPSNFAAGVVVPDTVTAVGIEITRTQFTDPLSDVTLTIEISPDSGNSWPPAPGTKVCGARFRGNPDLTEIADTECTMPAGTGRRARGRLQVSGAAATGTVSYTWRPSQ